MLVLSRKRFETVVIAKGTPYETTITVAAIRGGAVRLGIDCDRSMSIDKGERLEAAAVSDRVVDSRDATVGTNQNQ